MAWFQLTGDNTQPRKKVQMLIKKMQPKPNMFMTMNPVNWCYQWETSKKFKGKKTQLNTTSKTGNIKKILIMVSMQAVDYAVICLIN